MEAYQDLRTALHVHRDNEHLGEGWVEGELDHLAPERGETSRVVQSPQHPQLEHGVEDVVLSGGGGEEEERGEGEGEGWKEEGEGEKS